MKSVEISLTPQKSSYGTTNWLRYLLDQFINSSTNRRADSYGGPIQNRARLLMEVVDSVSKVGGRTG